MILLWPRSDKVSESTSIIEALRLRLSSDHDFRGRLARIVTATPKYEDYVARKKRKNEPVLEKDRWEALVFGKKKTPPVISPEAPQKREQIQHSPDRGVAHFFEKIDLSRLPGWPIQRHGSPSRLMAEVPQSYEHLLDWLNRGKGVDQQLKARVIRRDQNPREDLQLDQPGPLIVIAPPKSEQEALRKVEGRYGGDWRTGANDLVRATIGVDSFGEIQDVVDALRSSGMQLVARPRDRFLKPTDSGYRDVIMYVRLPNGHVSELQLHLKPILKAKEQAHQYYSRIKGLDRQIRLGGRGEFTDEQLAEFDENMKAMRKLYSDAWKEARETPSVKTASEEKFRWYDFDGVPVVWKRPKLPQVYNGKTLVPIDDLAKFAERAIELSVQDFRDLVQTKDIAKTGAGASGAFETWWNKTYKGKRVPNPNPDTRDSYPEVAASTAMKDPQFRKKVYDEFAQANKSQEAAPQPEAAPTEDAHLDLDAGGFKQVGPQGGSNPGGLFEDAQGQRYYVKTPKTEEHARNEILGAKLYELAGVPMPTIGSATMKGKPSVYSKIIPGVKRNAEGLKKGTVSGVGLGMAADAWLSNWDVIGLDYDNLLVNDNNEAIRLDTGGTLRFRAMGEAKGPAFGPKVKEMDIFTDPSRKAGGVFGAASREEILRGFDALAQVKDEDVRALVEKWGPKDSAERQNLYQTLLDRREDLKKWRSRFEQDNRKSAAIVRMLSQQLRSRKT